LRYIGPAPGVDVTLPLPEGWPAADHDEPSAEVAEAKIASGYYRRGRRGRVTDASDSESPAVSGRDRDDEGHADSGDAGAEGLRQADGTADDV
jgi:hypothetical protein